MSISMLILHLVFRLISLLMRCTSSPIARSLFHLIPAWSLGWSHNSWACMICWNFPQTGQRTCWKWSWESNWIDCRKNGITLHWKNIPLKKKIYKELEKKHDTWDKVIDAIDKGFHSFQKQLKEITREDIKLTEKPVRHILQAGYWWTECTAQKVWSRYQTGWNDLATNLVDFAVYYEPAEEIW